MFAQFSARLYAIAADNEYELTQKNGNDISDTSHWIARKMEMTTLSTLHVVDATKINFQTILENDKKNCEAAEPLLERVGQIANIYILASDTIIDITGAEEYYGQPIYSIFWQVNPATGEITIPKGQPKKIFNIRKMLEAAAQPLFADDMQSVLHERLEASSAGDSDNMQFAPHERLEAGSSFAEITNKAVANRPTPKYRHAWISYLIIFANAAILGLMYLDGYYSGDITVATRFGAIVPEYVFHRREWYRLFAAMFLHFGVAHFAANAMGILIFGSRLERYFGRRFFLAVYLLSGLVGSVFSVVNLYFFQQAPHIVAAGASGAVYGLVGAMFAYTRITKRTVDFINWYVMIFYIGIGMVLGFATPGIDNAAHIGGLIGGAVIGTIYVLAKKSTKK
ncbi:MAG: rhomboid family intramembrane serine protease [Defluviitaleaceae bacterium]|nr:rhomboid family intramembrane serine protease [Defluviitaleaceae bacterium]